MKTKITKLQTTTTEDRTIRTVHFELHSEGQKQYAKVDLPDADENNFIPFEDIAEETVLGWISDTNEYKQAVDILEKKVSKANNVDEAQLPWLIIEEDQEE